jgi:hypothetical protein
MVRKFAKNLGKIARKDFRVDIFHKCQDFLHTTTSVNLNNIETNVDKLSLSA